ncbi:ribosome maturation factor RimM [Algihabitans albus]|uniref:ribosome maturation factor RimM n=1 Tax=Algihabitans albus TaxID=2164067 RepID=UPI000E5C8F55|nr:ribosome maturation factor RimM [Algihabitans albus]
MARPRADLPPAESPRAELPWAERRVCLAAVAGAQGVRGQVRLKTFTERPEDALAYGVLRDEAGDRVFRMTAKGRAKDLLVAAIEGVTDRDTAAALRGTRLYVDRAVLPPTEEEEYYHADLLGLEVMDREGQLLGRVRAIYDFGAGDVIEVQGEGGGVAVLPFTRQAVPEVDLAGGRLVVDPPAETGGDRPEGTGQSSGKAP